MASQQVLFAETIAGMKKAFKRKAYESDSDSDVENHGNRGNKLKKRARFARQGQLVPTQGPSAYKELVDFAGSRRAIIHRNPPLVDDEGYEVDSDDDDGRIGEAALAAVELNPYANIRLEHILAPLTASTALPTHSTLSKPFVSKTLTNLVSQSCELTRRENQSLWHIRHLWTSLCGDGTWMPCELMVGLNDVNIYTEDHVAHHLQSLAKASGAEPSPREAMNGDARGDHIEGAHDAVDSGGGRPEGALYNVDVPMVDAGVAGNNDGKSKHGATAISKEHNGEKPSNARQEGERTGDRPLGRDKDVNDAANKSSREDNGMHEGTNEKGTESHVEDERGDSLMKAPEHAFIHPMFAAPVGARPDRNLGLPEHEAEDIRRLFALYVQKQEEICRGATKLHHGLLKAERLRKDVLHWAKAEAHCGPNRDLSDGEDWYDKDEWGLTEDLKKGQDEEEEDATAGKKTRNRR
ncbi:rxt2-like protein [Hirsutella rhossiliensis]|uniref:Rxt2-like protein n=1 Tax=Hirsutella rhossiliensis TaxID=111463 RepID=A0A9P8MP19_9HYPO|nr:rxt2-like protein [Hirsutella rhossiliensis]KAH0958802.1 rxt2-like protein [Hirsutella rhossiliensis]